MGDLWKVGGIAIVAAMGYFLVTRWMDSSGTHGSQSGSTQGTVTSPCDGVNGLPGILCQAGRFVTGGFLDQHSSPSLQDQYPNTWQMNARPQDCRVYPNEIATYPSVWTPAMIAEMRTRCADVGVAI